MGWFAVSPIDRQTVGPSVPGLRSSGKVVHGTLMTELAGPLPSHPLTLFSTRADPLLPGDATLASNGRGALSLSVETASGAVTSGIDLGGMSQSRCLRIHMTWGGVDTPARLWVAAPDMDFALRTAVVTATPIPSVVGLSNAIAGAVTLPDEVAFVAASDCIEPIGPMPGLAPGTRIATPSGSLRLDALRSGQPVCVSGAASGQSDLQVISTLASSLPARGSFRPVQLFAPYFGLTADLELSAAQHVTLTGPDVEYLFARETVLVAARHLVSRNTGRFLPAGDTITWHQVLLPGQGSLHVGGCRVTSLRPGRLRRFPEAQPHSLLAHLPRRDLPHPAQETQHVLTEFEAVTLLDQLARGSS